MNDLHHFAKGTSVKDLDAAQATIHQLRPLVAGQPWGIFFIEFDKKRLPVVVLRRILSHLVVKKRASSNRAERAAWHVGDLLFISAFGNVATDNREIAFAHFHQESGDLPTLHVLGWDGGNTSLTLSNIEETLKARLCWPKDTTDAEAWRKQWSGAFRHRIGHIIRTANKLAEVLGTLAGGIRDRAKTMLEAENENGPLTKLFKAFQTALLRELTPDTFADTYAQSVTYGLLTAAFSHSEIARNRKQAPLVADKVTDNSGVTNPFLREMLETFLKVGGRKEGIDFDELGIQDVVELLRSDETDICAIIEDFGNKNPDKDPVIHFYEDFLSAYNKQLKIQRGVFYTPQPVVSYIVRSVHELLRTEFGIEDGLASIVTWGEMAAKQVGLKIPRAVNSGDPFVVILDPATGTGTFLVEAVEVIHSTLIAKWKQERLNESQQCAAWNEYVPKHLLPRIYGYELMMAPYAIAHMKLPLKLKETGFTAWDNLGDHDRVRIYLTNALEPASDDAKQREFEKLAPALAHEAQAVNEVKRHQHFTVIIGNPPYSNFGQLNKIPFILNLLEDYKRGLDEKKVNLDDDFIKFVRFGQYCISQARNGILGMITNNTFVDGPTRRLMRASLAESFDVIRIVDLHGNSIERETAPDGSVDQNVFDIQQGVAISLFSRLCGINEKRSARLLHADVFGLRDAKYQHLRSGSVLSDNLQECDITPPLFRFQPSTLIGRLEYDSYTPLNRIFPISGGGVKTDRDSLCFDHDPAELAARMRTAFGGRFDKEFVNRFRIEDSSSYDLTRRLRTGSYDRSAIRKCLYRLFDVQFLYYQPGFTSRPAWGVMQHLVGENIALLAKRQARDGDYNWFFVVRGLVVDGLFSIDNKGREQAFPLYLRPNAEASQGTLIGEQTPNLSVEFIKEICALLGPPAGPWGLPKGLTPEILLNYTYAVFHSPGYRRRYAELLKIDFPRLPLTGNLELFRTLARLGGELIALHLLESPKLDKILISYIGAGKPEVEKISCSRDTVWLDKAETRGLCGVAETEAAHEN